jgi:hypothetical protein
VVAVVIGDLVASTSKMPRLIVSYAFSSRKRRDITELTDTFQLDLSICKFDPLCDSAYTGNRAD